MFIIRSDKYNIPQFCNQLIEVKEKLTGKKLYVEQAKYVDVENNVVFILNGKDQSVTPTYGTIRRIGRGETLSYVERTLKEALIDV